MPPILSPCLSAYQSRITTLVLSRCQKTMSPAEQVLASSNISKDAAGSSNAGGGGKQSPMLLPQQQNPSVLLPAVRGVAAMIAAEQATAGPLRRQYQVRKPASVALSMCPATRVVPAPQCIAQAPASNGHASDTDAQPPSCAHPPGRGAGAA